MDFTMKELKAIISDIVEACHLDHETAVSVVAFYNVGQNENHDILRNMQKGDFSAVPSALSAIRAAKTDLDTETDKKTASSTLSAPVKPSNTSSKEKTTKAKKHRKTDKLKEAERILKNAKNEIAPPVDAEIVKNDQLPEGFSDTVQEWMDDIAKKYQLDLFKISGQQWRAVCLFIGEKIKKSGITHDTDKLKRQGGTIIYNPNKVLQLLYIWEALTSMYKHTALACDFIAFSGVSRQWFYDTEEKLSSSQIDIRQKLRNIEESALSVGLVDGRENPTGKIFYSKARLGWRESVEIVHTSSAPSLGLSELPKLEKIPLKSD